MIADLDTLHTAFSSVDDERARKVSEALGIETTIPKVAKCFTREEAITLSGGMDCREMKPNLAKYPIATMLQCQIGKVLDHGLMKDSDGKMVPDLGFHLVAYGHNWNAALKMLAKVRS